MIKIINMIEINKVEDIVFRLISEFSYSEKEARQAAQDLLKSDPKVKGAFDVWWDTGVFDDALECEGYTLDKLIKEHSLMPVAAFLTLDWLIKEPEKAKRFLEKGYDMII
ncbi:MAG: hypothetical protein WC682_04755 [Parcubacteria group bacterium]|jgi:hypothetical protein